MECPLVQTNLVKEATNRGLAQQEAQLAEARRSAAQAAEEANAGEPRAERRNEAERGGTRRNEAEDGDVGEELGDELDAFFGVFNR